MSKYIVVIFLVIGLWAIGGRRVESLTSVEAEEYYKQQAEIAKEQELIAKAKKLEGKYGGQCLIFARNFTGIPLHGYAGNVKTTDTEPVPGGVYKSHGHVGVVLQDLGDKLLIVDSNNHWDERIHVREIPKDKVLGYINI